MSLFLRLLIVAFILGVCYVWYTNESFAAQLSKREVYQVYCGIDKHEVTKDMKELSRREIWSHCTGQSKYDRPKSLKSDKSGGGSNKPFDYLAHVHANITNNDDPHVKIYKGALSKWEGK